MWDNFFPFVLRIIFTSLFILGGGYVLTWLLPWNLYQSSMLFTGVLIVAILVNINRNVSKHK